MLSLKNEEFIYLTDFLKKNYGINLVHKRTLIEGRLNTYLSEKGYTNYSDYIKFVINDKSGNEMSNLLNRVTTNHTYFMREAEHFNYLKNTVLPFMESRIRDFDFRIWCSASSSGEEPYTLAMILQDFFNNKRNWDKKLLATDISNKVLELARAGRYSEESIKNIPDSWKKNYFTKVDDVSFEVKPNIKSEVIYKNFNLMDPFNFKKPFHVVFCRNVMIYFDQPTKIRVVDKMYDSIYPGGFLFIGLTESLPKPNKFKYIMPSVYQKGID